FFFFQAEDGIRDKLVTGVQTCALPILGNLRVGAIGAKVWLLYLPMYILGYALVETRHDLGRLLGLLSLSAVLPAVAGVVEALFKIGRASCRERGESVVGVGVYEGGRGG